MVRAKEEHFHLGNVEKKSTDKNKLGIFWVKQNHANHASILSEIRNKRSDKTVQAA